MIIRVSNDPNPCYPGTFSYDDEHDNIVRDFQAHRGNRRPAPARSLRDFRLITSHLLAQRRNTAEEGLLAPALLIYGSAIRNRANSPGFSNMQFSNRQLYECLTIMSLIFLEKIRRGAPLAPLGEIRRCSPLITSHLLAQRRNTAEEGPLASELQ